MGSNQCRKKTTIRKSLISNVLCSMQIEEDACRIYAPIRKCYIIYLQILVPSGNSDRFEVNERELQSVLGDPEIQDRKVGEVVFLGRFFMKKSSM